MPDLSPEAQERARGTMRVADIFAAHADEIERDVAAIPDGHVLVAVVDAAHQYTGTHHVNANELVERVPALEHPGGWAMVFYPGTDAASIRRRTQELASIAGQRIETIDRITARRNARPQ